MDEPCTNDLFTCKYSSKTDAITVTIHTTSLFTRIQLVLTSLYLFQPNKNKNGLETSITDNDVKTVITLYDNNKTIFIQGKGCRHWKENVLDDILENESLNTISNESSSFISPCLDTPSQPSPSSQRRSSITSPLVLLNRLVNSLRSPSKRTPLKSKTTNTCSSVNFVTPVVKHNVRPVAVSTPVDISLSENVNLPASESDSFTSSSVTSIGNSDMEETNVKQVVQNELSLKEMEKSINLLRSTLNEQCDKTGKLELELSNVKESLKVQNEKNSTLLSEIGHLKKELSSCTARCLILEEDKSKMKKTIEKLSKEKSDLLTQLIKVQNSSETTDSKIQDLTDCMEIKVQTEINSLKQCILHELAEIKTSIANKTHIPKPEVSTPNNHPRTSKPAKPTSPVTTPQSTKHISQPVSKPTTVYIAGDSMTKRFSPSKMSDNNISFKIRSQPGAKTDTINNNIKQLKPDEKQYVQNCNFFLLHVGTNDVSNGESVDSILSGITSVINSVKSLNPDVQIVCSSILPRKSEKVVNNIVSSVNKEIKSLCEKFNYFFLDNDSFMVTNGRINYELFFDHVHLNASGVKLFCSNIRKFIESLKSVQPHQSIVSEVISLDDSSSSFPSSGFNNGRSTGRRTRPNNNHNHHNHNNNNHYTPQNRNTGYQHQRYRGNQRNRNWSSRPSMMYYPGPPWMMNNNY